MNSEYFEPQRVKSSRRQQQLIAGCLDLRIATSYDTVTPKAVSFCEGSAATVD